MLESGNSPFTQDQDERLASVINYGVDPYRYSRTQLFIETCFRPEEKIAAFFYVLTNVPPHRGPNNGYIDKFGNEWVKGPSRTKGEAFEWDIQLSPKGKAQLGWASRDGTHLNISLDGKITHK